MKKSSLTVGLSLLAVFVSGAVVGAIGHRLYTVRSVSAVVQEPPRPNPEEFRRKYVEELRSRLHLEDGQVAKLNGILDSTRDRFHQMRERSRPEAEQIKQDQRNQVRAMLNAPQQAEYEKILQERDNKKKNEKKP
jgi:uncharacterized membrane protein